MKSKLIISGRKAIESVASNPELKPLIKIVHLSKTQQYLIEFCKKYKIPFEIKQKEFFDTNYGDKTKYKYKFANAQLKHKPSLTLKELINKNPKVIVMIDHVQDPFNLGAILRTCAAAGVEGIILPKDKQAPLNHEATLKSSQGYALALNIAVVSNLFQSMLELKKHNYWIYATALDKDSKHFKKIKYSEKTVIIIGSEGNGVSDLLKKKSDYKIYIPMKKGIDSLNVSVATGIILFEIINQLSILY